MNISSLVPGPALKIRGRRILLALVISLFIPLSLPAGALCAEIKLFNWSQWKGPDQNGISKESDWDPKALSRPLSVNWKVNVGEGFSNVAISGYGLFTMGFNRESLENTLYRLDLNTGKPLWKYTYKSTKNRHTGPKCTPVIDGSRVYTLSQDAKFFCNDTENGKLIWEKNLADDFGAEVLMWELSSSVRIEGNAAIINALSSGIAFDKNTGKLIWKSRAGEGNYATPVTFKFKNKTYAAIYGQKGLNMVDALDGSVKWFYPWSTQFSIIAADPYIYDNRIFISSGYENGCALIDISSGLPVELWRNKNLSSHFSTVVILGSYIYGVDGNAGTGGSLKCLDMKDGSVRWSAKTGFGNMTAANGYLIMVNEKGSLYIVKADPNRYIEVSKKEEILGKLCWTAPVLCRSTIYIRNSKGDLVSIDVSKK